MNYVVDITHPRAKESMIALGISSEELVKKTLEDFEAKDIPEEIKQLRFSYFRRKQQELVRQLKQDIKHNILKSLEKNQKSNFSNTEIIKIPEIKADELAKIKEKHRKKITMTLQNTKKYFDEQRNFEEKKKKIELIRQNAKSLQRQKIEQFQETREKHKENLKKIKKIKNSKKYLSYDKRNCVSVTPRLILTRKETFSDTKNFEDISESDSECEILSKIEKYQEKMSKSKALYELCKETKRKAAAKLIEKAETITKAIKDSKQVDVQEMI